MNKPQIIFHFINDFHSRFYKDLFDNFSDQFEHLIFSTYTDKRYNNPHQFNQEKIRVIHRFYPLKYFKLLLIPRIVIEIKKNKSKTILIHPNSAYIEGFFVLLARKLFGIKFIVTLRNSDINFYQKNWIKKSLFYWCIENCETILLKSPALKDKVPAGYSHKISIINNGVNDYWLDNLHLKKNKIFPKKFTIVTVGDFYCNKNIDLVIRAVAFLNLQGYDTKLIIAGKEIGDCKQKLIKIINDNKHFIEYYGFIDKSQLKKLYRKGHLFAMISNYETFGLVYLEALSQGLPVIFTKNQGIDGFIPLDNGKGIIPSEENLINTFKEIFDGELKLKSADKEFFEQFRWRYVAKIMEKKYREVLI